MITLTNTSIKTKTTIQNHHESDYCDLLQVYFLQVVIESLEDGILILNEAGKVVHANAPAYQICTQLRQEYGHQKFIHPVIWQLCQSLIDRQSFNADKLIILSDEIVVNRSSIFRIRVRCLNLKTTQMRHFLVTIENRNESLKNIAISEVIKYDLTPREAEIWSLYRGNYSYKDIAAKLYITINTVKKHMKNIHAKRQAYLEVQ
ncbi:MAG: helix-turn-helix transcriptional regulator [Aulosira sp. ZfuVER01]|nr:LuxR C-terminal-related transcriptional regulator [Aulosira sp. ZfuVER01]MDZ8002902.1 LuxR C-terminal-related transcriptional regulator [Aulosira sp. DedVER01a]MDZ8053585.1 LuxR C-terminal-related transcriptional regulator [Aulosira sp. ZfuCHP01]